MKESEHILNIQELETLCRLYSGCRLSVAEETELEYVLLRTDVHSPVIDETRRLMGISHSLRFREAPSAIRKRNGFRRYGYAAAVAVALFSGSYVIFNDRGTSDNSLLPSSPHTCVAYVGGNEVSGVQAEEIAEADIARMEMFMRTVDEKTAEEEAKVTYFLNHNMITE